MLDQEDTSQQSVALTDDETANAKLLFPDPDEESTPDSTVAQDDGSATDDNGAPTDKAPTVTDGEMGDGKKADENADAAKGKKSTDGDGTATEESSDELDPDVLAEADAIGDALLGSANTEPAGDPQWKVRAGDNMRRLNDERRIHSESKAANAEALATVGYQMIETAQGPRVARADDFKDPRVTDFDANEAWAKLPEAERARFKTVDSEGHESDGREAFKLAYENGVRHFADKLPPVTATTRDSMLPESECNRIYAEFTMKTLPNGKPMFPDCDTDETRLGLQQAADSQDEVMLAMRDAGAKSAAMHHALLELTYNRYFRATYERKALIARAKRQKTEQANKDKKGTSVPGTGGGTTGNEGGKSAEEQAAAGIGSWQGNTHAPDGTPYVR